MTSKGFSLSEVLKAAEAVATNLSRLRTTQEATVMFVDLVGSTSYKEAHPDEAEWLPRLAAFLTGVSKIVGQRGRVVKYIGDEVMALFDGDTAILDAEHATEQVLEFCEKYREHSFEVKVAVDHGPVSLLSFGDSAASGHKLTLPGDPQGLTVDKCARIMSRATGQVVLCSQEFYDRTKARGRWRHCGSFRARGVNKKVRVYQLAYGDRGGKTFTVEDSRTPEECEAKIAELQQMLVDLKKLHNV